ncbi:MAG: transposase family protein [Dinoroseobacter sp.]|nr:transposase family protein [Dinoroseobacter sp.]
MAILEALYPLLLRHGTPEYIRSDNGPEFASEAMQDWLRRVGIKPIRIYPGSPWENGYNERFNGTLRQEVLNAEWFTTTKQAQSSSMTGSDSTITRALIKRSKCARQSQKPN